MRALQTTLEKLSRHWWFYLLLLCCFFLPAYTSLPLDPRQTPALISAVLSTPLVYSYPILMPVFKAVPVLLIAAVMLWGRRFAPLYIGYVSLLLVLLAVLQNTAITEQYGLAVLTGNVLVYLLVALVWWLELFVRHTAFDRPSGQLWRYWVVPVAMLALWFPIDESTLLADFSLKNMLSNSAGLTSCMILPLFVAHLTLYAPQVNRLLLRVSGFAGAITALLNILQWFILAPSIWMGSLHLPLLILSGYAFWLSFRPAKAG